ncbi:MAG: methionyl-tRNA formyltransferase [Rhodoferax sp.]|nr:methionyl-tRNA formyltransferase [Rhodoferax sp.]
MRVIFAGTPEFARTALQRLHASGHTIALVLTQPDRPAGRGMKLQASAVKQFALEHGIPVAQPRSLKMDGKYPDDAAQAYAAIAAADADVMVVAAYGLILPQWVLDAMQEGGKFGCLNIHASLLPRWRGAAPIHRAIEAGDAHTGVTIMQMDAGLDTGAMLFMHSVPIEPGDTTASLHDRLADLGGKLIVLALEQARAGRLKPIDQPSEGVTYAHKVEKHESAINWSLPADVIARRIRAFNPFPGASTSLQGEVLRVWAAQAVVQDTELSGVDFGTIMAAGPEGIAVAAMDSVVVLTQLQRAGGKRLAVSDFLRGFPIKPGMRFV